MNEVDKRFLLTSRSTTDIFIFYVDHPHNHLQVYYGLLFAVILIFRFVTLECRGTYFKLTKHESF